MTQKTANIPLTQAAFDFILGEIELVHALCDRAGVARDIDGEILSMAQRVTVLESVCSGLVGRLGMEPLHTSH